MHEQSVSIALELRVAGETFVGRASDGTGRSRDFSGWLGLVAAIDALVPGALLLAEAERPPTDDTTARRPT